MADLIDRITFDARWTGRPKLNNHAFSGWLRLYAGGLRSRGEVATAWNLQGDELSQANALADNIDAEVTAVSKMRYVLLVDGIAMMLDGWGIETWSSEYVTPGDPPVIDKVKVKADLGIS